MGNLLCSPPSEDKDSSPRSNFVWLEIKNIQHEAELIRENHPLITSVRYDENDFSFTDEEATAIAMALRYNVTVKTFSLNDDSFPVDGHIALSHALEINTTIESLELAIITNDLTKSTVIASMVRQSRTKFPSLKLVSNDYFQVDGIINILNAMKDNTVVAEFELRYSFDSKSQLDQTMLTLGGAVGDVLKCNNKLEKLDIQTLGTPLNGNSIEILASGLQGNKTLKRLIISQICNDGIFQIANALRRNKSLQKIELCCFDLKDSAMVALFGALEDNESLHSSCIWGRLPSLENDSCTSILNSLKFNDTLISSSIRYSASEDEHYIYNAINIIINQNFYGNRIAPLKSGRKRCYIFRWLLGNPTEL